MIELEFIESINETTLDEFRGTPPNVGDEIVFGGPSYGEVHEIAYKVLSIRRYYYAVKGERYEVAQVLVARCE